MGTRATGFSKFPKNSGYIVHIQYRLAMSRPALKTPHDINLDKKIVKVGHKCAGSSRTGIDKVLK